MQDYVHSEMGHEIEQFRAVIFKHFLWRTSIGETEDGRKRKPSREKDTPELKILQKVCNHLISLAG